MKQLAPSILAADFSALEEQVSGLQDAGADFLHMDIMDGHFVPNISFGPDVMKDLADKTSLPFDVHLMIETPDRYLERFMTDQTRYITVHQEACPHLHRTLAHIRECGAGTGVAINPATPLTMIEPILEVADLILIMSVNPGFGGQSFIPETLDKIRRLDERRKAEGLAFLIEVDGGIDKGNIETVSRAGADIFVAGSAVFGSEDVTGAAARLKEIISQKR